MQTVYFMQLPRPDYCGQTRMLLAHLEQESLNINGTITDIVGALLLTA